MRNGNMVGCQGQGIGTLIYSVNFNERVMPVTITVGDNGFIVGANINTSEKWYYKLFLWDIECSLIVVNRGRIYHEANYSSGKL